MSQKQESARGGRARGYVFRELLMHARSDRGSDPFLRPDAAPGEDGASSGVMSPDDTSPFPRHDARILTDGGATATILLDGQSYVLRITRTGKLILTK